MVNLNIVCCLKWIVLHSLIVNVNVLRLLLDCERESERVLLFETRENPKHYPVLYFYYPVQP